MKKSLFFLLTFWFILGSCDKDTNGTVNNDSPFAGCVESFEPNDDLEIVTFNLENFPKSGNTIMHTAELLEHLNADVVAVQEISSEGALVELANQMEGWEAVFTTAPTSYGQSLGYLVKATEVELLAESTQVWFEDDTYNFPRTPFVIKVRHRESGQETLLVNLHLKAMGDDQSVGRRRIASTMLQEYIDVNHPDDFVIVLGDWNDELNEDKAIDDVFSNFSDASELYRFVDETIADGGEQYWSYPSWPSHIDHILITDEWFSYFESVMTVRADQCFEDYEDFISDHRPVVAVFDVD
ncbi:endonuclease/exonuclease/phosphatase family protein [Marinilabilia salmonicolor]|jgi:endonuclease/exonuclease/phosphatase family metal-dependent hydrolase|uniref:endonuclease/exonuclease/phosphatase family protein n=1 Tax=Marinilabilia salmonicolor TaxID=989 RepID=UPI000D05D5E6|nr:endonuclease/exonuclease/phosphatase family protein [Marinilabilia salmonicolor]PRZ00999.1 endonuclease/exonuclease/phosphatase family protein [Marinilabilia salmonicolor]